MKESAMKQDDQIRALAASGHALCDLYTDVSVEQSRWRPAAEKWSLLEILCHLGDEEREDFRQRVRLTLEDPSVDWPPIAPQGWVNVRSYNERDLAGALADFERERVASLDWLRGLEAPSWENARRHPVAGSLRAGDLLASWVAHDLLHMRQIVSTRLAYLNEKAAPYSTAYALP